MLHSNYAMDMLKLTTTRNSTLMLQIKMWKIIFSSYASMFREEKVIFFFT